MSSDSSEDDSKIDYVVEIPRYLPVFGYRQLGEKNLVGVVNALSPKFAVAIFLKRQESYLGVQGFRAQVLEILNNDFGSSANFAREYIVSDENWFTCSGGYCTPDHGVTQSSDESSSKEGLCEEDFLTYYEKAILNDCDLAVQLAMRDGADLTKSHVQMHYLEEATSNFGVPLWDKDYEYFFGESEQ